MVTHNRLKVINIMPNECINASTDDKKAYYFRNYCIPVITWQKNLHVIINRS